MNKVYWLIEHISRGAYIDVVRHPKTGRAMILCRAESRRPAMIFASHAQAAAEIERLGENPKLFCIQPLNTE